MADPKTTRKALNAALEDDKMKRQFDMLRKLGNGETTVRPPSNDREHIAARLLLDGKSIRDALLQAGFSTDVANRGRMSITPAIMDALVDEGFQFDMVGKQLIDKPELAERTVMGFLYRAMADRNSRGVNAAKLMGMHKKVNMFVADQQQNVLIIQAPTGWEKPVDAPEPKAQPNPREKELPEYE